MKFAGVWMFLHLVVITLFVDIQIDIDEKGTYLELH